MSVTSELPIYSGDENDFVPAEQLTIGEKIKTRQGYIHTLKILGQGGDIKIYGKIQANCHIIYSETTDH